VFPATGSCCSTFHPHEMSPRYRSAQHPDEKNNTSKEDALCTPVEPALASQREREKVYNNGCLSKGKEHMTCLRPILEKQIRADVVVVWLSMDTNGFVFLSFLTLQLRFLSMSQRHTHTHTHTHTRVATEEQGESDTLCPWQEEYKTLRQPMRCEC